jgi:hypothetical protein
LGMSRFIMTLSDEEKTALERVRAKMGVKSNAEAVRRLIAEVDPDRPDEPAPKPAPPRKPSIKAHGYKPPADVAPMRRRAPALDTTSVPVMDREAQRQAFLDRQKGKK